MSPELSSPPSPGTGGIRVKIFGVGSAGISAAGAVDFAAASISGVDSDAASLAGFAAGPRIHLETKMLRGLGTGGDPERGRELAEAHFVQLKTASADADVIFIFAGLGGGAGTGMAPVLARAAKESGALVLAFVTLPFSGEGNRRQQLASAGLAELKTAADGVISLPCQKVVGLLDENASLLETFQTTTQILLDGARGVWRVLVLRGLIPLHFADLCALLRDRHAESWFAAVEASGAERSSAVMEKLFAHPLLQSGAALAEADSALISLIGGPELSLADVNRVMEQLKERNGKLQLMLGAVVDEAFRGKLALTVIAARSQPESRPELPAKTEEFTTSNALRQVPARRGTAVDLGPLESREPAPAVRPAPARSSRSRKNSDRLRQTQLPLEIVSKSRFEKTEATILNGEDLDVPTYIRRGIALN